MKDFNVDLAPDQLIKEEKYLDRVKNLLMDEVIKNTDKKMEYIGRCSEMAP